MLGNFRLDVAAQKYLRLEVGHILVRGQAVIVTNDVGSEGSDRQDAGDEHGQKPAHVQDTIDHGRAAFQPGPKENQRGGDSEEGHDSKPQRLISRKQGVEDIIPKPRIGNASRHPPQPESEGDASERKRRQRQQDEARCGRQGGARDSASRVGRWDYGAGGEGS